MPIVPHNFQDEVEISRLLHGKTGTCIFCTLIDEALSLETTIYDGLSGKKRLVYETGKYVVERGAQFVAVKPFASHYEWEVHILPMRHQSDLLETTGKTLDDLAWVLRRSMARLNVVIGDMQYNYFLHTVPYGQNSSDFVPSYHWHIEICPRNSITSGFEIGSGLGVNTIGPEEAAARLRQDVVSD